jgi:hypothetical protein
MPGMIETGQVGKRQDLSNYITNIERTATPLFTMLRKDDVHKTTFETQVDDYGETDDIAGVASMKDADSFSDQSENRGIIENSVQKMWEKPGVDDFAENVNENPALPSGEYTEQVRKAVVRLKFRVEKKLLSRTQAKKQGVGGATAYETCSIGGFVASGAPTGTQVVPERYRTPAAHLYTGTVANLTVDTVNGIMQEIFEATHGQGTFTGILGSEVKERISNFSIFTPTVASTTTVRSINSQNDKTLQTVVDVIKGDFGVVALMPSTRVNHFDGTGAATSQAVRRGSGFILDLNMWGLAFKRRVGHKQLENKGGGPRGIVDTIFALRCKNPVPNGALYVSG